MINATLCLVDANSLFYRAYFAIKTNLATSSGQPTNAVFGFVRMVNKILETLKPEYLAVCFDVGKLTHRSRKFSAYKINRPPMPEPLVSQLPYIKELVSAYNFAVFEAEGFEADDVIASIARRAAGKIAKIIIVSSDKDILQLVDETTEVYNPYKDDGILFTEERVRDVWGVEPKNFKDLIALTGDASDNIPGARGIGEKTARDLLGEFKDIAGLKKNISQIKRDSLRKAVEDNLADIELSLELAALNFEAPVDFDLEVSQRRPPDTQRLWELFTKLEFKGLLKSLARERAFSAGPCPGLPSVLAVKDSAQIASKTALVREFAFFAGQEDGRTKVNAAFDEEAVYTIEDPEQMKALFTGGRSLSIGCDIKGCRHILAGQGVDLKGPYFDAAIAAYLCAPSKPSFDLENLLWDYLSLPGLPRRYYAGRESFFLLKLKKVLALKLRDSGLEKLFYEVEMPLVDCLFEMEDTGVCLDVPLLKSLSRDLEKKLTGLTSSVYEAAGSVFNLNSPKQLSDILFNKLKLPVVKRTKTGISTDEEVLTKLAQNYPLPKLLLEYRQLSKLKSTYLDALPGLVCPQTGKIHTTFNQAGTQTGRLSSNSPNLQNIPVKTELGRRIRQAFVPSPGFRGLLSADYSQIELRVLAHLSRDAGLIQAFEDDLDVHARTAALIFGVEQKDVSGPMRENAKRVNFGIIYGMSPYGLAKDLNIDTRTAENFIQEYFLRYPGVKNYLDRQIELVKKNGYAETILGRRRYIPEINNVNTMVRQFAERQAVNTPIQGSAADLIKLAMLSVCRGLKTMAAKSRLILQVHDELVFEFVEEEAKDLFGLVRQGMQEAIVLRVPLKVTLRAGKNWLENEEV